jgi:hypothetical protein
MTTDPLLTPTETFPAPLKIMLETGVVPVVDWVVFPVAYIDAPTEAVTWEFPDIPNPTPLVLANFTIPVIFAAWVPAETMLCGGKLVRKTSDISLLSKTSDSAAPDF